MQCNRQARCDPFGTALTYEGIAGCVAWFKASCLAGQAPLLTSLVGVTTSYSSANHMACAQSYTSLACDEEPDLSTACQTVFTGALGNGASCWAGLQCQPSHFCAGTSDTQACGTCQPRAAVGNACESGGCALGAYCNIPTGQTMGTCRSYDVDLVRAGQACNITTGPSCRGVAGCQGATQAAPNGTCATVTVLGNGATCDPASGYQSCGVTQQCALATSGAMSGTCTNRPTSGQACDFSLNTFLCDSGSFCSAWEETTPAGTCVARRLAGGACNDPDLTIGTTNYGYVVCDVDLYCDGQVCAAPAAGSGPPSCP